MLFNKADLYRQANRITRAISEQTLRKYFSFIKWRLDGQDSVLDAGCGTGDVTSDILMPMLPSNFHRLVGVDISDDMLTAARKMHVHPKLFFEHLNLDVELEKQPLNGIKPFDHITSFFCLMWVQNQRVCLQNFYKLLNPDGDMLLLFVVYHPVYDIYEHQSQDHRWAAYMTDVKKKVSPYYKSENPELEFLNLLKESGFTDCDVKLCTQIYTYKSFDQMRGKNTQFKVLTHILSLSAFIRFLPCCKPIR